VEKLGGGGSKKQLYENNKQYYIYAWEIVVLPFTSPPLEN